MPGARALGEVAAQLAHVTLLARGARPLERLVLVNVPDAAAPVGCRRRRNEFLMLRGQALQQRRRARGGLC